MVLENTAPDQGLTVQVSAASYVLDSSALLIYVRQEYDWERVESMLPRAVISTVNFAEVLQRMIELGLPYQELQTEIGKHGVRLLDFTPEQARVSAELYPFTQPAGLGLGDRACLGLAQYLNLPAVTKETSWVMLDLPVQIIQVGRSEEGRRRIRRRGGRGRTRPAPVLTQPEVQTVIEEALQDLGLDNTPENQGRLATLVNWAARRWN
jgi:ribonuclease VapC